MNSKRLEHVIILLILLFFVLAISAHAATVVQSRLGGNASASGTVLNIQLVAPTVADLVTIYRGASCRLY